MKLAIFGYAHPFGPNTTYGAERVIWYLVEELKKMGHECVVFSVKGTNVPGHEFVELPICWLDTKDIYLQALEKYEAEKGIRFDHIHSYQASGFIDHRLLAERNFSIEPFFSLGQIRQNKVAYSYKLRSIQANLATMIHFGIPDWIYTDEFFTTEPDDYYVWIGRMDHGKAPDIAIDIAERAGVRLLLMGPAYHYPLCHDEIFSRIDGEKIIWLRATTDAIKRRVFRKAKGFINPIFRDYHEMLGLVNLESLACGVPIIGFGNADQFSAINWNGTGEIFEHGKHGFIIQHHGYGDDQRESSTAAAVDAIQRIDEISREECRKLYLEKWTSKRMTQKHVRFFEILKERGPVVDVTEEL